MAPSAQSESVPKSPLIFLSHAGSEIEAARALAVLLRGSGMDVWLDAERIQPGDMWQREITSALMRAQILLLYIGRTGVAKWVDFEVQLALDRSAREGEFRIIPVLGPNSDSAALPHFVRLFQWVDLRETARSSEELKGLIAAILKTEKESVSLLPPDRSPFAGLRAFDVGDSLLFFGRDAETQALLTSLGRDALLTVIGDSGCGKSSLVRAGLIPALLRGRFHDGISWVGSWRIAITRPGNDPFGELAESLPDLNEDGRIRAEQISSNRRLLATGVDGLRDIIAGSVPSVGRTLLVIDQFEEIFTGTSDTDTRRRYIDCVLRSANIGGSRPVHVVLTLRADFYARCWEHPDLPTRIAKNQYPVGYLGRNMPRQLIEKPLSLAGARAEPGLVETILAELGDEKGNLPLLEHTLDQLWRNRRVDAGVWITHEAYERMGRLSGGLGCHANEAMERLPDEEARSLAQRFFVELVQLGEGTEDTRRRVAVQDLLAISANREKGQRVLAQLASERLIITGEDHAELAHEALIRAWPELRKWVDAERISVRTERHLLDEAREWERLGRDPAALLAGARLRECTAWSAATRREVPPLLREYIQESLRSRRNRRLKMTLIAAGISSILGVLLAWTYVHSRRLDLIKTANLFLDTNPACAVAVALRADAWRGNEDTRQLLEEAVQASTAPPLEHGGHLAVYDVAFSPNGEFLATGGEDHTVRFWDAAADLKQTPRGLLAQVMLDAEVPAIAFSLDGTLLAAGTSTGTVRVLTVPDGSARFSIPGTADNVTAICFGPDSNTLAVGYRSGKVSLWKLDAPAPNLSFERSAASISALAFSQDGKRLATAARDGTIALRLLASSQQTLLKSPDPLVDYVAFFPSLPQLMSAGRFGQVRLWRLEGESEIPTPQSAKDVTAAVLGANGRLIATSHRDHTLVIRDASLKPSLTIARQDDAVTKLALNPKGDRLAASNQNGQVRIYELNPARLRALALRTLGQARVSQLDMCRDSVPSAR